MKKNKAGKGRPAGFSNEPTRLEKRGEREDVEMVKLQRPSNLAMPVDTLLYDDISGGQSTEQEQQEVAASRGERSVLELSQSVNAPAERPSAGHMIDTEPGASISGLQDPLKDVTVGSRMDILKIVN